MPQMLKVQPDGVMSSGYLSEMSPVEFVKIPANVKMQELHVQVAAQ